MNFVARREHWWNLGEAQAIAVYRAKVISPVLFLWAATGLPFLMFPDMRQPEALSFIIGVWIAVLVAILIRRRRAAIFTSDFFLYRPAFGRLLRVPLKGVKRASLVEPVLSEEYYVPRLRIELLVGPEMTIPIAVSDPEAVVRLLNKGAGRGLTPPPNPPLEPTAEKSGS